MDREGEGLRMVVEVGADDDARLVRLRLGGTLDIAGQGAVRRVILSVLGKQPSVIEVDLADVDVLEAVCAGYLAREQTACGAVGIELRLLAPQSVPLLLLMRAGASLVNGESGSNGSGEPGTDAAG